MSWIFGRKSKLENANNRVPEMPTTRKGRQDMGQHRLRVCIGWNDDGSPVTKRVSGNSEIELADNVAKAIFNSERRRDFFVEDFKPEQKDIPTFYEYAENWLETYKIGTIKPTTLSGYRTYLNAHLYPAFGNVPLNSITTKDIQKMLNEKSDKAGKTLRDIMVLFRSILESAKKDKLIDDNPADDSRLKIPSSKKTERRALEVWEVKDIIDNIDLLPRNDDRQFIALLIFTGMRRGEILGLRWEDIDLENNVICVRRNVTYPGGRNRPNVGTPKTKSGERTVPIFQKLLDYLLPLKEEGFIFGGDEPLTNMMLQNKLTRIGKIVDMHGATPHVFRHSFATMMYDSGSDIKTIQSVIGQKDYKTTTDRYCHARDDKKQTAVTSVGRMLS